MYIEYFGLKEEPFNLTPDPRFLYLNEGHREALARLQFGIEMRKGLMIITGEVGVGKTMIVQSLVANKKPNQNIAYMLNPRILGNRLIQNICREFGIDLDFSQISKADILNILYEYVLQKSFYEQNFVVIIDDAHELANEQLEDVLLLTKLETNTRQLLQLVLVGLPTLLNQLRTQQHLPLAQRIQLQFHLKPFSYSDTRNYMFFRLSRAGLEKPEIFTAEAVQRIFQLSWGVPRTISVLASNVLLYAYLHGHKKIDHHMVNQSTDESLQRTTDTETGNREMLVQDKFPPRLDEKQYPVRRKRRWIRWIIIALLSMTAFVILNIFAQYMIEYFDLF